MKDKRKIYLVGDSTVQTYKLNEAPQCGWGAMLYRYFGDNEVCVRHSEWSGFGNATTYELENIIIDNRAMGARSLKSFLYEGRLLEVLDSIKDGDLCLIQSAHNDAYEEKQERYLTPFEYKEVLIESYVEPLLSKKAKPVLVTAIAMKDFDENGTCRISFPDYRDKMLEVAHEYSLDVIDLGKKTAEYNTKIGEEACRNLYMNLPPNMYENAADGKEDNAHLRFEGAFIYAGFVADRLKEIL